MVCLSREGRKESNRRAVPLSAGALRLVPWRAAGAVTAAAGGVGTVFQEDFEK